MTQPHTQDVASLLGFGGKDDASLNLQGALHDLKHRYSPNDGGVCASTIARVISQIESVRTYLLSQSDGGERG